jgi:hypothetical protein
MKTRGKPSIQYGRPSVAQVHMDVIYKILVVPAPCQLIISAMKLLTMLQILIKEKQFFVT